jgi:hypothetical protein
MTLLEQHVHQTVTTQLQKLQADLSTQTAQWASKTQADSQEKEGILEVRTTSCFVVT